LFFAARGPSGYTRPTDRFLPAGDPAMNLLSRCAAAVALAALASLAGLAQQPKKSQKPAPKPCDALIEKYLAAETDRLSPRVLDGARTLEEWQKRKIGRAHV